MHRKILLPLAGQGERGGYSRRRKVMGEGNES